MGKRLRVRLADGEMELIRRLAKAENLSVEGYVRRVLREFRQRVPTRSVAHCGAELRDRERV